MKKTLNEVIESVKGVTHRGITFIHDYTDERFISYQDFFQEVKVTSRFLMSNHIRAGDEAVLQLEDEKIFLIIFWACLRLGIIPVPLTVGSNEESIEKIIKVWECLGNPCLLTDSRRNEKLREVIPDFLDKIKPRLVILEGVECQSAPDMTEEPAEAVPPVTPDSPAFIQFSSGSTGDPKGVILTHKNLLTNIYDIIHHTDTKPDDSSLSWMPLTHDMGLIGFHLSPLAARLNQFIIPTAVFIRQPLLWIKKIHQHRISNTSSPNFGYKHLLTHYARARVEDGDMDLSCLKIIFNGGEPISASLCDEFHEAMCQFGLKKMAMLPSYGLAEASLAVSFPGIEEEFQTHTLDRQFLSVGQKVRDVDRTDPNAITLVDLGFPLRSTAVRICDANDNQLAENTLGFIHIKGDNVSQGYYNNPTATRNAMTEDGWLKTGDLGFTRNKRLVWSGRSKDIIFNNGYNYYSYDLELLVEGFSGLELGKTAAAGVWNEKRRQDDIIFFVLFRKKNLDEFAEVVSLIKQHIGSKLGLRVNYVIPVGKIPKTTSGKIQRYKLVEKYKKGDFTEKLEQLSQYLPKEEENDNLDRLWQEKDKNVLISIILGQVEKILGYGIHERDRNFMDMGVDSLKIPHIKMALEDLFHIDLPVSLALDYPTVNKMADYIYGQLFQTRGEDVRESIHTTGSKPASDSFPQEMEPIAVIGMSCRFPGGADNPGVFWEILEKGHDTIERIPAERWDIDEFYAPGGKTPGKIVTQSGGFLRDVDMFDALFFGITPVEAVAMDPQQRLLLEVSYEALENAGLNIKKLEGSKTGVFIGISSHDYIERLMASPGEISRYAVTGSMLSTASGRISYTFGFQGPSMSIDTACSSSAVALCEALLHLRGGGCDLALVGGVNLLLSPKGYISFSLMNVLSPEGKCKSFDESADGYGRSEGCGIVILKRLSDAMKDKDPILALIRGGAVNHDGRSSGLTVPNGLAQEQVIHQALDNAGVKIEDIDYVEAHGSGTKLGDSQEINALANVYKHIAGKLTVGSVKTNIGHTESAAAVAGLIKVILALNNGIIPQNLHFKKPSSFIPWDNIPIRIATEAVTWRKSSKPRIAGLSSFSLSGTNSHLIVQEAPINPGMEDSLIDVEKEYHILTLSTKPPADLFNLIRAYIPFLTGSREEISNICYTSNMSRSHLEQRFAMVVDTDDDIPAMLSRYFNQPGRLRLMSSIGQTPPNDSVVFMFTGQNSIYTGIGKQLYQREPVFKEAFDRCDSMFGEHIGTSLKALLDDTDGQQESIPDPLIAQSLIFTIEYALFRLWQWWGVKPSAVVGHSIGEIAAAHAAGVLSLEDSVKLVALRGKIMTHAPREGKMVGVLTREDVILPLLEPFKDVSVAAINAPDNITISGSKTSVDQILTQLKSSGVFTEHLDISHAFHSVLMEPVVDEFRREIESISFSPPHTPFISTITGQKAGVEEICSCAYWSQHLTKTVLFHKAMKTLQSMGYYIFVELGGTAALSGLAGQCLTDKSAYFLPSLRKGRDAREQILNSLAKLYLAGVAVDWEQFHAPFTRKRKKVLLPNYHFHKRRYWIDLAEKGKGKEEVYPAELLISVEAGVVPPAEVIMPGLAAGDIVVPGPDRVTGLKAELKEIINIISGLKPEDIGDDTDLFSFGLDSLLLLEFKDKIQEKYGVDIALTEFLMDLSTIKGVSDYIANARK